MANKRKRLGPYMRPGCHCDCGGKTTVLTTRQGIVGGHPGIYRARKCLNCGTTYDTWEHQIHSKSSLKLTEKRRNKHVEEATMLIRLTPTDEEG
jgi:hypothetical protein